MKNWLWAMVLVSLLVPLGGCGASDVLSPQSEQALQAAPAASGENLASPVASSLTVEDIPRITPAEAKELLDSGRAVLYDVRSEGVYRARHAQGALSFPASDMVARYGELPTDKSLVFY
jgi:hypothetical protein